MWFGSWSVFSIYTGMRLLSLCCVIVITSAFPEKNLSSGRSNESKKVDARISGGQPAEEDFYYHAQVYRPGAAFCSGVVINPLYVLTAGHCVEDAFPEDLTVRYGSRIRLEGPQVRVEDYEQHPEYDFPKTNFDIAYVKTRRPMNLEPTYEAIRIYNIGSPVPREITVSGFGFQGLELDHLSEELMFVTLPIISQLECQAFYPETPITKNMICAHTIRDMRKGFCIGDWGAPAVDREFRRLIGIASFSKNCGRGQRPSVFTFVEARDIHDFIVNGTEIDENMKKLKPYRYSLGKPETPSQGKPEMPSQAKLQKPSKEKPEKPSNEEAEKPSKEESERNSKEKPERPTKVKLDSPTKRPHKPSKEESERLSKKKLESPSKDKLVRPSTRPHRPSKIPYKPAKEASERLSKKKPEGPSKRPHRPSKAESKRPFKENPEKNARFLPGRPKEGNEGPSEEMPENNAGFLPGMPKEVNEEPSEKMPEKIAGFLPGRPADKLPERSLEDVPEPPSQEKPERPSKEKPERPSDEIPEGSFEGLPEEPSKENPVRTSDEIPEKPFAELPDLPSKEKPDRPSDEISEKPFEELSEGPSKEKPEKSSEEYSEKTTTH